MKTYLDMDEILHHCSSHIGHDLYDNHYLVSAVPEEVIRSLPPVDVVEVVRCRNCYFRALDGEDIPVCTGAMAYSHTPDDWFCAAGKLKDERGSNNA